MGVAATGRGKDKPPPVTERLEQLFVLAIRDVGERDDALGQSAGLVEADLVHAAEGLERPRVADERVARSETASGRHLRDGGERWEPFGHRGHRQSDSGADGIRCRTAIEKAEPGHQSACCDGHRHGQPGQRPEALFDTGRRRVRRGAGAASCLGVRPTATTTATT